jgi:hypothetical protein
MNQRIAAWAALAALCLLALDCAGPDAAAPKTAPGPAVSREARKFPEVEIVTVEGDVIVGKLARLEPDGRVAVLPVPYWGVEMKILALDAIDSVRLMKRSSAVVKGALSGIPVVGIIGGIIALAMSKYDEDFMNGLWMVPAAGIGIGVPIGLLAGGAASLASPSKYDFRKQNAVGRMAVVRRLMGI